MRKPRLPPGTPDDTEHAFYDALQQADLPRLMACWADEDDIVCVLPGGQRLLGHAAVRAAFDVLLAHGGIKALPEQVRRLDAGNCSVHSVLERIELQGSDSPERAWVLATNVYAKTAQGWRMVAHHASPGVAADLADRAGLPTLLH